MSLFLSCMLLSGSRCLVNVGVSLHVMQAKRRVGQCCGVNGA